MKKRVFLSILGCLLLIAGSASAGVWDERFDYFAHDDSGYADQAALDDGDWVGADGKANGILDDSIHYLNFSGSGYPATVPKAMMCQKNPTETRPSRTTYDDDENPSAGIFSCWVYDDGVSPKQFDVRLVNGTNYVGLGLVGTGSQYTINLDGTVSDSGIDRATGWHFFQFSVGSSGTMIKIDGYYISTYAGYTVSDKVVVYTNLGGASDLNQVWIDNARWEAPEHLSVPLTTEDKIVLDKSFEDGGTNWGPINSSGTLLTHITDNGRGHTLNCLDANSGAGGDFGFGTTLTGVVPADGAYKLGFHYINGPNFIGEYPFPAVTNLTVSFNGQGAVNLGSTAAGEWVWSYAETGVISAVAGDDVTISVTGGPGTAAGGLLRIDHFTLIPVEILQSSGVNNSWTEY